MKLRLRFGKRGAVKFIGHLDIMRYFQKAFRRAGVDISYSKGFHPHPVMSFASPLGLGLESCGEYMDIEVNSLSSPEDLKNAVNAQMTEGIEVFSVNILKDDAKNSMSAFAAADYTVRFRDEPQFANARAAVTGELIDSFLAREQIIVLKKTKKSEKEMDIRPLIYQMYLKDDESIFMQLSAGSAANLKPELVVSTMFNLNSIEYDPYMLLITRLEMYARDKESGELIPLEKYQLL